MSFPTAPEELRKILTETRPHYVFHLAGVMQASSVREFYEINTAYAASLIESLKSINSPVSLLMIGSAAEYGSISPNHLPISEEHIPQPCTHYGISKFAQTLLGLASNSEAFPTVIARPFNIIGAGMPSNLAIQSFVDQLVQIKNGQQDPVIRVGNLKTWRDYIHLNIVVEGYWKLIRNPLAYGRVVNICSGEAVSMEKILNTLITLSGLEVKIETDPSRIRANDTLMHYGNNTLFKSLTELDTRLDLNTALREAFLHSLSVFES